MTGDGGGTNVRADGGSHGAVAGTIHGGVYNSYYQVPDAAAPDEKFEIALNHLASGQATTARALLSEVTGSIRASNEVWFYWLLAFFSGRTLWELTAEDEQSYTAAERQIGSLPRNTWSRGIDAVRELVTASRSRSTDEGVSAQVQASIYRLDDEMRGEVLRHLERVLHGSLKDDLWHEEVYQARAGQKTERREDRVWMFFEPDPANPRTRAVKPADVSAGQLGLAGLTTAVVAGAVGVIGWLLLQNDDAPALIMLTLAVVAAGVAVVNGAEWRFRDEQRRKEERLRRIARLPSDAAPRAGFARKVDKMYLRYARKYAPDGPGSATWYVDSYVPMSLLRDEMVEAYRETRVRADQIKWLIRFQVREIKQQWVDGTLVGYRQRWSVLPQTKAFTAGGAVAAMVGMVWAIQAAARQNPLRTVEAVAVLAVTGWVAVLTGLHILAERRRATVEEFQRDQRMTTYWFEFQRWRHRLSDRPTDMDMARWLECDRRMLLHRALETYQLKWSDISAYASLEARGGDSRKARAKNGPWRFSRYQLLVFLLTADGVRQVTVELDFAAATLHDWERTNYRYDAVAAVRVQERDDGAREFRLFLVNGDSIEVDVTEPGQAETDEDPDILAAGAQDATGLRNTLFVLEGVAAEGRRWWKGPAYRRAS
ncbi:hypothetical protein HH310_19180 [Actinoplanes sp. TBRC 11911]|uniref:hypothetical protein n=1 Tax=Actinoplanes sp. TBRC 11911 TaxID=2729386 RepID=UPI00145F68DE|nr:hypothetical protein [Actinoplanes sp. TBRC 11911]NMO53308.1 hypothetical protein [Actinoplanes sp. TBRC 11911]